MALRLTGSENARSNAKRLRREMIAPEIALWQALRRNAVGLRFRRQYPAGSYVLDFYCASARLAIEVDGEAHERGQRPVKDVERDTWLRSQGIRVLRYTAKDVLTNLDGVARHVLQTAGASDRP